VAVSTRLDIIGNGFDLHHHIPSRFVQFGAYVRDTDLTTYRLLERYFAVDDKFWNDFEARLADFDADFVMEDNQMFLPSYGADDWSDSGHHDYEYEIEGIVRRISETLRGHFADWVKALPIPDASGIGRPVPIDPTALFLSFNYTPTLQRAYGVPDTRVLHIHGRTSDPTSNLVLGHGWERPAADRFADQIDEDTDVRVAGGYRLLDDYFEQTFKPTAQIIVANTGFFDALRDIEVVRVMGHALGEVDAPYYEEMFERFDPDRVLWTISYYDDLDALRERALDLGIPAHRTTFRLLADF